MPPVRRFLSLVLSVSCVDFTGQPQIDGADQPASEMVGGSDTGQDQVEDSANGKDSGDPVDGLEPARDYTVDGPWPPGNLQATITGSSGSTLYLDAWFPSSESGSEHRYYGWDTWGFEGETFTDVTPDCTEPRPVMVHSHGNNSIRWEMFYLQEFLSTHGWIVVAPDHEGNTFYANTEDFNTLRRRRPQDIQDTFDWLIGESEDPSSALYGCIEPDGGYVVSGYSFGGYTALATAGGLVNEGGVPTLNYGDSRVWAVVSFAPWNAYGSLETGTSAIEVPALTLGGERDSTVSLQYQSLHSHIESTPRYLGSFANAGHYSFTPIYCSSWGDGCGPDYIEPDLFTTMTQTAVISVTEHLRGRSGAIEQLPEDADKLTWESVE